MASEEKWPARKIKKIYHELTRPVIQEIKEAVDAGIIKPVDPDLTAYSLTGQIEMMSLRLSLDDKYNVEDIVDFIAKLSLNPLFLNHESDKPENANASI